jgi:hypothetical protein
MAGATTGQYLPPEEFERLIVDIGRVPAERTTLYDIRHEGVRHYDPKQPQTMRPFEPVPAPLQLEV